MVGEVKRQGTHSFQGELSLDDYIDLSAGLTRRADDGGIYIVKANGSVVNLERNLWRFTGNNSSLDPEIRSWCRSTPVQRISRQLAGDYPDRVPVHGIDRSRGELVIMSDLTPNNDPFHKTPTPTMRSTSRVVHGALGRKVAHFGCDGPGGSYFSGCGAVTPQCLYRERIARAG